MIVSYLQVPGFVVKSLSSTLRHIQQESQHLTVTPFTRPREIQHFKLSAKCAKKTEKLLQTFNRAGDTLATRVFVREVKRKSGCLPHAVRPRRSQSSVASVPDHRCASRLQSRVTVNLMPPMRGYANETRALPNTRTRSMSNLKILFGRARSSGSRVAFAARLHMGLYLCHAYACGSPNFILCQSPHIPSIAPMSSVYHAFSA